MNKRTNFLHTERKILLEIKIFTHTKFFQKFNIEVMKAFLNIQHLSSFF